MVWGVGPSFMSTSMPITVPPMYKMGCPEIHELKKSLIWRSTEFEKSIFSTACSSEHCGKILQEIQATSIDFDLNYTANTIAVIIITTIITITIILTAMSPSTPHSVNDYGMRSTSMKMMSNLWCQAPLSSHHSGSPFSKLGQVSASCPTWVPGPWALHKMRFDLKMWKNAGNFRWIHRIQWSSKKLSYGFQDLRRDNRDDQRRVFVTNAHWITGSLNGP